MPEPRADGGCRFLDPAGRFAFSHNGDLRRIREARRRYQALGRIHGRADTEVGARWLEDEWSTTLVYPGQRCTADRLGNLVIEVGA